MRHTVHRHAHTHTHKHTELLCVLMPPQSQGRALSVFLCTSLSCCLPLCVRNHIRICLLLSRAFLGSAAFFWISDEQRSVYFPEEQYAINLTPFTLIHNLRSIHAFPTRTCTHFSSYCYWGYTDMFHTCTVHCTHATCWQCWSVYNSSFVYCIWTTWKIEKSKTEDVTASQEQCQGCLKINGRSVRCMNQASSLDIWYMCSQHSTVDCLQKTEMFGLHVDVYRPESRVQSDRHELYATDTIAVSFMLLNVPPCVLEVYIQLISKRKTFLEEA